MTNLVTISEASKISGVNRETLKKRCQRGDVPGALMKGKTWLLPERLFRKDIRTTAGLYIDGANLFYGSIEAGWNVDYQKLIDFLEKRHELKVTSFYDSHGYEKDKHGKPKTSPNGKWKLSENQMKFFNKLRGIGYRVVTKPLKCIDGDINNPKNNMDSYLTIDALKERSNWEVFLLFSGDSDFDRLVQEMVDFGKEVRVFSYSSHLAHELKMKGFNLPQVTFTELDKLEIEIAR